MSPTANKPPFPDFSDDVQFTTWFQRYAWAPSPHQWDIDTVDRIHAESLIMRRELDRRMKEIGDGGTDRTLFRLGFSISAAGVVLLFFPPAGIPALLTTTLTIAGMGVTVSGAARTQVTNEAKNQLLERSRDLNNLQQRLLVRKRN